MAILNHDEFTHHANEEPSWQWQKQENSLADQNQLDEGLWWATLLLNMMAMRKNMTEQSKVIQPFQELPEFCSSTMGGPTEGYWYCEKFLIQLENAV